MASEERQKRHSCVLCAQRKVKCDKKYPCANCIKAVVECVPGHPAQPRRRKKRAPQDVDMLVARLRQCETLLQAHGLEMPAAQSSVHSDKLTGAKDEKRRGEEVGSTAANGGGLLIQEYSPPYPKTNLWAGLGDEILDVSSDGEENEFYHDGASLILGSDRIIQNTDLTMVHPKPVQIFKLWQQFLDCVNPLIKPFHAPTVQHMILEASSDISQISRPTEALMFAIYYCAVNSMTEETCISVLGNEKAELLTRYHDATRHALAKAKLLKSTDLAVLQAFLMFILCIRVRRSRDTQSLWILTGVAVRMGQRIGLHRESSLEKLSPFEAEIRRRLWWQIFMTERRTAHSAGVDVSLHNAVSDTKVPLNVNDSDLDPAMSDLPIEHEGPTEMMFCLMRFTMSNFAQNSNVVAPYGNDWHRFLAADVPIAEKEAVIDELDRVLERRFLRHCDPVIPLHSVTATTAKSLVGKMRLMLRHPRQQSTRGTSMTQEERDKLFAECIRSLEYDNNASSDIGINCFRWHITIHFQLDLFVYVLHELCSRPTGRLSDEGWTQIFSASYNYLDFLSNTRSPLNNAIANLMLKSWSARETAYARQSMVPPEGSPPPFIATVRAQIAKRGSNTSTSTFPTPAPEYTVAEHNYSVPPQQDEMYKTYHDNPGMPSAEMDPSLLSDGMDMDISPLDWAYWNALIQGDQVLAAGSDQFTNQGL